MTLVSDIQTAVIIELSQIPGTSVQIYAAPRIQQHIQDAYIMMIDHSWWPNLMRFFTVVPDGTTGRITSDLTSDLLNHKVSRFQDIRAVYPVALNKPLMRLPTHFNPYTLSGSNSVYIEPDATFPYRPFMVWPVTSADQLVVNARLYPIIPMSSTDTVYLDQLLLTYLAAYMYAEDDGTNPGQINKFKAFFEKRLMQVTASWNEQSTKLDPRYPTTEYEWSERE